MLSVQVDAQIDFACRYLVCTLVLGISPQDRGKLLPAHIVVWGKAFRTVTVHNTLRRRPSDRLGVPCIRRHIGKSRGIIHHGLALHTPKHGNDHSAAGGAVRRKHLIADTVHNSIFQRKVNAIVIPGHAIQILIGRHNAAAIARAIFKTCFPFRFRLRRRLWFRLRRRGRLRRWLRLGFAGRLRVGRWLRRRVWRRFRRWVRLSR